MPLIRDDGLNVLAVKMLLTKDDISENDNSSGSEDDCEENLPEFDQLWKMEERWDHGTNQQTVKDVQRETDTAGTPF